MTRMQQNHSKLANRPTTHTSTYYLLQTIYNFLLKKPKRSNINLPITCLPSLITTTTNFQHEQFKTLDRIFPKFWDVAVSPGETVEFLVCIKFTVNLPRQTLTLSLGKSTLCAASEIPDDYRSFGSRVIRALKDSTALDDQE